MKQNTNVTLGQPPRPLHFS